jgi:hypothetical protein
MDIPLNVNYGDSGLCLDRFITEMVGSNPDGAWMFFSCVCMLCCLV